MSFSVIYSRKDGSRPEWAVPYKIYVTAKGTRIGVIGATAEYTAVLFEAWLESDATA